MALILGLDPSRKTGWAYYDTNSQISAMKAGVLKAEGKGGEFEDHAGSLARALVKLFKEHGKPDFAILERAPRQVFGAPRKKETVRFMGEEMPSQHGDEEGAGGGLQSTLSTNQMAAALAAILGAYGIPFETMETSSWRKAAYGFGRRKGWSRPEWKKHSRQMCSQMRIAATNDDMAEACWIAFAGASCQTFKDMMRRAA